SARGSRSSSIAAHARRGPTTSAPAPSSGVPPSRRRRSAAVTSSESASSSDGSGPFDREALRLPGEDPALEEGHGRPLARHPLGELLRLVAGPVVDRRLPREHEELGEP